MIDNRRACPLVCRLCGHPLPIGTGFLAGSVEGTGGAGVEAGGKDKDTEGTYGSGDQYIFAAGLIFKGLEYEFVGIYARDRGSGGGVRRTLFGGGTDPFDIRPAVCGDG